MPGIPTEHLAEQIEATNRRLADEVHALGDKMDRGEQHMNDRIIGVERRLDDLRADVATEFGKVRADMASELGKINANLESIRTRLDGAVGISRWSIGIMAPIIISLIGAGFWLTWHAARLDFRVDQVEKAVSTAERPGSSRR